MSDVKNINGYNLKDEKARTDVVNLKNESILRFNNIQEMIETDLKENQVAMTLGYTNKNDKGSGIYYIEENALNQASIRLNNGLYANLKVDNSEVEYIFPNDWGRDVDSGDCFIIKALGKTLVFDSHRAVNYADVEQFFEENNVLHIDYFFLSHYHADHMGNFVNFVNNGYIDENTILYFPQTASNMLNSALYLEVINCVTEHDFSYTIPEENSVLHLGMNVNLEFYNTDPTYIEQAKGEWNNCSMLVMFKHGDSKTFLTGDAQSSALKRATNNGFIKEKINLLKVPHHAIINTTDSSIVAMELLRPDYAVQTAGTYQHENAFILNPDMSYLKAIGTEMYATYNSADYIVLKSTVNSMQVKSGKSINNISNGSFTYDVYVDCNTDNEVQDGKQATPFKSLPQAISRIERTVGGTYTIHLADGDYSIGNPTGSVNKFRSVFMGNDTRIAITGNTSNKAAVKIHNGFSFYNAKVSLTYLTIYTDVSAGVFAEASEVAMSRVDITSPDENATNNSGVIANSQSNIFIGAQCSITKTKEAIRINQSTVNIASANISNNTKGITNNFGTVNFLYKVTISDNETEMTSSGKQTRNEVINLTDDMLNEGFSLSSSFANYISREDNHVHISAVIVYNDKFNASTPTIMALPSRFKPAKDVKALAGFGANGNTISGVGYSYVQSGAGGLLAKNTSGTDYDYATIDMDYYTNNL